MHKKYEININEEMKELSQDVDKNFNRILEINKLLIIKVIKSISYGGQIDYDDLYQEALIELYRTAKKYKNNPFNFVGYYCQSLRQRLINYVNKNQYVLKVSNNDMRAKKYEDLKKYVSFVGVENMNDTQNAEYTTNDEDKINYGVYDDERLNIAKENLSPEEWEMVLFMAEYNNLSEYGRRNNCSREIARLKWNKIKNKIKSLT